jgi:hypothetical protein
MDCKAVAELAVLLFFWLVFGFSVLKDVRTCWARCENTAQDDMQGGGGDKNVPKVKKKKVKKIIVESAKSLSRRNVKLCVTLRPGKEPIDLSEV